LSEQDIPKPYVVTPREQAGILQSIKQTPQFLASVQQEMKLVQRPSWQEVSSTTVVVIVFLLLFLLYFYALDRIFSPIYRWLFLDSC
jgi:preprotein translocase SecE subunit